MPFPDRAFASVVASEVIEHMPNYRDAIQDIARVASRQVLFTVPDNSVLPVCAPHGRFRGIIWPRTIATSSLNIASAPV